MTQKVEIVAITEPCGDFDGMTPEQFIAAVARVSNPSNQKNIETTGKLLKYCIDKKHWSIFEQVTITMSVETTRDIGRQILRHGFRPQEFSQRYANPSEELGFVLREARLQDHKNRQNSIQTNDEKLQFEWDCKQEEVINCAREAYEWAIERGIAKEQCRVVLPEGNTLTKMYLSNNLRGWIHYIDVRAEEGTQKEHREIAIQAREEILKHFPSLEEYWFPEPEMKFETRYTYEPKSWWWKFWS